jgi:hypothetical protein
MKALGIALVALLSVGIAGCSESSEPGSPGSDDSPFRWIGRVDLGDPESARNRRHGR